MSQSTAVSARILGVVSQTPGCRLDEVVSVCLDLTWNQVFLEIDRLSRVGQVRLRSTSRGICTVWLPEKPRDDQTVINQGGHHEDNIRCHQADCAERSVAS